MVLGSNNEEKKNTFYSYKSAEDVKKQFLAHETIGKKMYGEEEEAKSQKNMV